MSIDLKKVLAAKSQEGLSPAAWGELVLRHIAEKASEKADGSDSVDVTLTFKVSAHAHPERVHPECVCVIVDGIIYACI